MDSKKRIKDFIKKAFPEWEKIDYSTLGEEPDFKSELSDLFKIDNDEIILVSYTNISITGSDRPKPQLRVFLDEYSKPFAFAKRHNIRFYLFSIFTKEDNMAKGLNNFNPKHYIISIETNFDNEVSRRDLRSIYDYANQKLGERKFLKCSRSNYNADINQASFIYIGSEDKPDRTTFENFINIFDSRPYLDSKVGYENGHVETFVSCELDGSYRPFVNALRTKPFLLLAGISGTGKSRLVRKLAQATTTVELQQKYNKGWDCSNFDTERWMLHKPENFELIQVKPNWHNSMDVVGYLSNIPTPHYVFTPFIRFVAKAWQNPEVPFFLCLDEMNLAPVEEYFAEFLSAIESRSKDESGYITDPIVQPFDSFGPIGGTMIDELFPEFSAADVGTELSNVVAHFKTKGVTLPENLMVIGTVNMDETTFSFSRKVLDRAMSIEMNEVDYDAFLEGSTDQALQTMLKEIGADKLNDLLVNRHVSALETDVAPEGKAEVIAYLKRINLLLDGTPYKLGYRAANEALIYVQAANDFGMNNWQAAMDEFTLMKILSRLEGDEAKLTVLEGEKRLVDAKLNDNENIKQGGRATLLSCLREIISQSLVEEDSCRSISKLDSMIEQLRREHFVSYWN